MRVAEVDPRSLQPERAYSDKSGEHGAAAESLDRLAVVSFYSWKSVVVRSRVVTDKVIVHILCKPCGERGGFELIT